MTNTKPFTLPVPNSTSAGPGQMPAKPQPMPNARLPNTRRLSMWRAMGKCIVRPSKLKSRLPAIAKATVPTAIAPPITRASEGSHVPAKSKKPSTFEGFAMPAKIKPSPNNKPDNNAKKLFLFN